MKISTLVDILLDIYAISPNVFITGEIINCLPCKACKGYIDEEKDLPN